MLRRLLLSIFLLSLPAHAQVKPPAIGDIMMSSPDARNLTESCVLAFSKQKRQFICAIRIDVQLSPGRETLVFNPYVTQDKKVLCGCAYGCNPQGMVLGYYSVSNVDNGGFKIDHAYAIGNEKISCIVY